MRIEESTVLAGRPEEVWAALTDWDRQASWMADVAWIRLLGSERELGTRLAVRTRVFGVPAATDLVTVTGWDPPHRLAVEHTGVVRGLGEWRLEPLATGTRFTWVESIGMTPPVLGELGLRAYGPWQRAMVRRSIRNFARIVAGS